MELDMAGIEKAIGDFAGLSAVTVALVGAPKAPFPSWMKGKEAAPARR